MFVDITQFMELVLLLFETASIGFFGWLAEKSIESFPRTQLISIREINLSFFSHQDLRSINMSTNML